MGTKPIVACVVLIAVLVFVAVLLTIPSKPLKDITVRHVKSVHSGDVTAMTFGITNYAAKGLWFLPSMVEARSRSEWKKCFQIDTPFPRRVGSHDSESLAFEMTNLPAGSPLRLTILVGKEVNRSEFFERFKLRVLRRNKRISLNPFTKNRSVVVFVDPVPVVSEEFVEPESRIEENAR